MVVVITLAVGFTRRAIQDYVTISISRRAVLFVSPTPAQVPSAETSAYISIYLLLYKHAVSSGHCEASIRTMISNSNSETRWQEGVADQISCGVLEFAPGAGGLGVRGVTVTTEFCHYSRCVPGFEAVACGKGGSCRNRSTATFRDV